MSTTELKIACGHSCHLSLADQHELCLYREAGVPIVHLASMWRIAPATVRRILAARVVAKKNLTRWRRLRMSEQRLRYAAPIPVLAKWLSAPRPISLFD